MTTAVGYVHFMPDTLRRLAIATMFVAGTCATVATTAPTADVSGESASVDVFLDADQPVQEFSAVATIDVDAVVAAGTGQIGLNVVLDSDAEGSLAFTLSSASTSQGGDIVDTQAQGTARIGIDAFDGCGPGPCDEELLIEFRRTDPELAGTLGLTFTLDGLASTETEPTEPGSLTFSFD
jgi:hypothetical protein